MNTALILSDKELHGLINLRGDDVSVYINNIIPEICADADVSFNLISMLQEKRLARWDGHSLILVPLLKLILDEACGATSMYEPEPGAFALECPNMHLLFTRYEWAEGVWRIAPFKDKSSLLLSLN